jgi:hypothetical protein
MDGGRTRGGEGPAGERRDSLDRCAGDGHRPQRGAGADIPRPGDGPARLGQAAQAEGAAPTTILPA